MQRSYKKAWSVAQAVALIEEQSGTAFDPRVVAAFRQTLPEILAIKARYPDDIIDPKEMSLLSHADAADDALSGLDRHSGRDAAILRQGRQPRGCRGRAEYSGLAGTTIKVRRHAAAILSPFTGELFHEPSRA